MSMQRLGLPLQASSWPQELLILEALPWPASGDAWGLQLSYSAAARFEFVGVYSQDCQQIYFVYCGTDAVHYELKSNW